MLGLPALSKFETILDINIRMFVCDGTGEESMVSSCMVLYKKWKLTTKKSGHEVMHMFSRLFWVSIIAISMVSHLYAADFNGEISITKKGKSVKPNEYADAVIYFVPEKTVKTPPLSTETREIKMEKKKYSPRVLPISVGTEVDFPNFDPILHNAFSTSTNNNFDLGLYSGGDKGTHKFEKPGLVRVYCNVHHAMVAYILVFDSPYYTTLSPEGKFTLKDLPDVPGQLFIWHPRSKLIKKKIDFSKAVDYEKFDLELTKRRIPKHSNKAGKSYRKTKKKQY